MKLKFTQLGGSRKTLELADHAAPHGRPRVGPVAADSLTLRESEVYVAGSDTPVRHLHGLKHGDWELHGRFTDYFGGLGFAKSKAAEVKKFVADQQPVRASWGDSLAGRGLITSFEPLRESEGEIEWKLTVKIDADEIIDKQRFRSASRRPQDYTNRILQLAREGQKAFEGMPLKLSVFDVINGLISSVASLTAAAITIANGLQSFESEAIGSLRRFRSAIGQLRTAVIIARDAIDALSVDLAIEERNYDETFSFSRNQAVFSDTAISIIKEAADADRSAQLAEQGKILAIIEAKGGDTFESLSSQFYGNAGRAEDIRKANGVGGGQPPTPGTLYIIPV